MNTTKSEDREIVVSRLFSAPRDLLFDAFTEREHVENWWAPDGSTFHEYNASPGGLWRYSIPGEGGDTYSFKIRFIEIDKPERLVYDYGMEGDDAAEPVRTSVTFAEENGKTRVTLRLMFAGAAERAQAAEYGAAAGAQQALAELADYIGRM